MTDARAALTRLIATETALALPPALRAVADAARGRFGDGVEAVLVYGSCLRDGSDEGKIVDLYLLVRDYASVYRGRLTRLANRLLPPNVFFLAAPFDGRVVRAKVAIVDLGGFERLVRPQTLHGYFWARFAQPVAIAFARDGAVRDRVVAALAQSVRTLLAAVQPLRRPGEPAAALWVRAFTLSYASELRPERPERSREIYAANADRYDRIAALLGDGVGAATAGAGAGADDTAACRRRWRWRRRVGKLLSVLRLIKAAFTFAGGADYLAWKIGRHAAVPVDIGPWARRHPILAAPAVLWRLYRQGAVR